MIGFHPRIRAVAGRLVSVFAVGLVALSACETGPVYKARGPGETVGYTDVQLAPNRYRVTFSGRTGTTRDEVENYLLRRASEVALAAGYEYFAFDDRETERTTYYRTWFDPAFHYGYWHWPYRPYYWSSWAFPPYWSRGDIIPVTRYTAYSEIVMLTPEQARNNPNAIPAREVLARLAPAEAGGPAG